jgi:2-polyprenyl-6-hydroxyphenyl methylase / 3-demethylubiquinone-9 3-methyltransferase
MEKESCPQKRINNDFYDTLKDDWYTSDDHPIALLRAENAIRVPWVISEISKRFGSNAKVLDVGCGAGFLCNALAEKGFAVSGVDVSESSLDIARKHDTTQRVEYLRANAYQLPFQDKSYDVVCAMDVLEHVEEPEKLIQEASRVLKKNGMFFFHTFNRNILSYIIVIKGVDWFVPNAPSNMHVYELFITPQELTEMCTMAKLDVSLLQGFAPNLLSSSFWKMLFSRKVPNDFHFSFTKNLLTGYCGFAIKNI